MFQIYPEQTEKVVSDGLNLITKLFNLLEIKIILNILGIMTQWKLFDSIIQSVSNFTESMMKAI